MITDDNNHSMPMGLEITESLWTIPIYIIPDWRNSCYFSVYTSLRFGWLNIGAGMVSTIHHLRTYHQKYEDWFRILDLVLACIYSIVIIFLFWRDVATYITIILSITVLYLLKKEPSPDGKCKWHALFHLIILLNTGYQTWVHIEKVNASTNT